MNVACLEKFTSDFVLWLMPESNKTYIKRYWPIVYMALDEYGLDYEEMALMTLGTITALQESNDKRDELILDALFCYRKVWKHWENEYRVLDAQLESMKTTGE